MVLASLVREVEEGCVCVCSCCGDCMGVGTTVT